LLKFRITKRQNKSAASPKAADFLGDLKRLSADDIAPLPPKKPKTRAQIVSSVLTAAVLLLCAGVFVYSVVQMAITLKAHTEAKQLYEGLAVDFFASDVREKASDGPVPLPEAALSLPLPDISVKRQPTSEGESGVVRNADFERLKAQLYALSENNPDTYGWLTVEGTNINYPVVQSSDNDYYLNRSFQKKYLPYGAIYVDFICSRRVEDNYNTVIYGHNVTSDGSMFNGVTDFLDAEFFDRHGEIKLYTTDGIFVYEVFSVYETDYAYHYRKTDFTSDEQFGEYINEMKDNSIWQKEGLEVSGSDRMITLSTCTSSLFSTRRYALQGRLIRVER